MRCDCQSIFSLLKNRTRNKHVDCLFGHLHLTSFWFCVETYLALCIRCLIGVYNTSIGHLVQDHDAWTVTLDFSFAHAPLAIRERIWGTQVRGTQSSARTFFLASDF